MNNKTLLLLLLLAASFTACKKNSAINGPDTPPIIVTPTDSTIAPANFNFNTTREVTIDVTLVTNDNQPIAGVPVDLLPNSTTVTDPLLTAVTDANGKVHATLNLPAYADTVIIDPKYVGLMRNAKAVISGNSVNATIGGAGGYSGSIVATNSVGLSPVSKFALNSIHAQSNTSFVYMGTYDNSGVPKYLEATSDVITSELLNYVNTSLPEQKSVAQLHPTYLQSSATADLNIVKTADVWITFVSEGAGYLNTLGYYTYPTGNAPKSEADITKVTYIFPNASLPGSGGNLRSGSKVKLGRFDAGTSIGFVLLANAWNGGSKLVDSNAPRFYTTTACNPETKEELKKHTVLLYAQTQNLYLIGIDDQNRQTGGSDNDFNDALFYATSNPVTAISNTNVEVVDSPKDSDGDGVTDVFDQFPTDPTRAYISYYPSKTTFGTVMFEDLWPATGDYDLNDMVVGYQYKTITNAKNNVVEMYANYAVKASGASFVSGFGVQFPFSPSLIKSVTGQKLIGNYINQNANGTESKQAKAVIIPFDNYQAIIKRPGGYYINTQNDAPVAKSDTVHIFMSFNSPISASTLGNAPFNPFLISNQRRGYEVHLPDNTPTDLADLKLFGTAQDNTNAGLGRYYKSKNAWPYALNFVEPFNYPTEGNAISKSYNYFLQWTKSGGSLHKDWYLNLPGYRNDGLVYQK
ncbi:LruC domain-containing protein [Mucilaginibacter psychrotolerans]|uniref:LruC domain-containing protein n=1 Tax=Mucilaginibacter psychrotolerans TaxID=1524096 RepID=A0A4Y8S699_9SPHI|nr:LruC domain-containing protein [Mucilaginibacter psychrotolerans]TFF33987.1 LruC domain-containing protein [Mucilaginibacter psychrotolerans]